jgi:hypothetical protein
MLEETRDRDQIIQRVAALDVGKAELTCCVRVPGQSGSGGRLGGGPDLPDDDPLAAGHGRPAGRVGRDPGGDGGYQRLLEGGLLPAGSGRLRGLAGQCPRRQAPPRTAQDRHAGRGLAVQAGRAADAAAQLRAATTDPAAAGRGPLPGRSGGGTDRREAAGREAAGGRPDQTLGGRERHLRGLRPRHAGRAASRRARPQGPQPSWPGPGCAPNSARWRRRSPGSSPTSTPSCSPRCWPEWTPWTPTWPTSTPSSPS